ncbi:MAG: putative toxin-antitoxin system toxin component, PIN family [Candidatus Binataceae bacterium]
MRILFDTNVLASAFGGRAGLCADLFRLAVDQHELLMAEVVLRELRSVLIRKFRMLPSLAGEIDDFLRTFDVIATPRAASEFALRDNGDLAVLGSAISAEADLLVTGDKELLRLDDSRIRFRIVTPRQAWTMIRRPPER